VKNASGLLESQVTYHYKMDVVPVWFKTDEMQKAFPEMAKALSGNPPAKPLSPTPV